MISEGYRLLISARGIGPSLVLLQNVAGLFNVLLWNWHEATCLRTEWNGNHCFNSGVENLTVGAVSCKLGQETRQEIAARLYQIFKKYA